VASSPVNALPPTNVEVRIEVRTNIMAETAVLGASSTTGNPSTTTTSSSSAYEADERIAARHAVTLAEEKWRSLCTQHASTFVAAERRSVAIQKALSQLLNEIECETKPSVKRVSRALDPNYKDGDDGDDDDEDEDDEEPIQPASALLADLADKHRLRRRTLMQHSSLLELLELPSLMVSKAGELFFVVSFTIFIP